MNTSRAAHTATLLNNGKVLIAGGNNGSINLSSAEEYDPLNPPSYQQMPSQLLGGGEMRL